MPLPPYGKGGYRWPRRCCCACYGCRWVHQRLGCSGRPWRMLRRRVRVVDRGTCPAIYWDCVSVRSRVIPRAVGLCGGRASPACASVQSVRVLISSSRARHASVRVRTAALPAPRFSITSVILRHRPTPCLSRNWEGPCTPTPIIHTLKLVCAPMILEGGERTKNSYFHVSEIHSHIDRYHVYRHAYVIGVGGGALGSIGLSARDGTLRDRRHGSGRILFAAPRYRRRPRRNAPVRRPGRRP